MTHDYYYKDEIYQKTVLHFAVEQEDYEIIKILLNKKDIDVNAKKIFKYQKNKTNFFSIKETNALCISIEKGNLEIIKLLLTREIDVNVKKIYKGYENDKYDYEKAPLHLAIEKGNLEILKLLLSFPSIDINSFEINTYNSSSSNYAIINSTALHYSNKNDNFEIFKLLLSHQDIEII